MSLSIGSSFVTHAVSLETFATVAQQSHLDEVLRAPLLWGDAVPVNASETSRFRT